MMDGNSPFDYEVMHFLPVGNLLYAHSGMINTKPNSANPTAAIDELRDIIMKLITRAAHTELKLLSVYQCVSSVDLVGDI